ncbi:transcriptional regulator [Burkholderia gladioli]|uniref:Transcriptional regulator n=1 Tax=Burkholderia gladioli TaxID=28095 RepID=A0A2A7SB30_BURGA|nr:ParB/RepB/Spo0J family partition protein [Burkholderia gladioli]PEH40495.1 transcriptional regulator [Burkholderia gladioli]
MASKFEERMREKTKDSRARTDAELAQRAATPVERPPVTMPAQLGAFRLEAQEYQRRIDELQKKLDDAAKSGRGGVEIPLDKLTEVKGRRRYMPPEQYRDLRENLRHNPLNHPVVVRPLPNDEYEIISGHHRIDAYREIGRQSIRAVLADDRDGDPTVAAFYANLFQSELTDYEKFLGFTDLQRRFPKMTQAQIAEASGKSEAAISFLMAFADLPEEVGALLSTTPSLLGSSSARELARLTKEGKGSQVVLAVQQLAAGEIDQKRAISVAAADPNKAAPRATEVVKIRTGRSPYCELRRVGKSVRLDFQSEDEAQAVQQAIRAVLESRAEAAKAAKVAGEK